MHRSQTPIVGEVLKFANAQIRFFVVRLRFAFNFNSISFAKKRNITLSSNKGENDAKNKREIVLISKIDFNSSSQPIKKLSALQFSRNSKKFKAISFLFFKLENFKLKKSIIFSISSGAWTLFIGHWWLFLRLDFEFQVKNHVFYGKQFTLFNNSANGEEKNWLVFVCNAGF